ncbi:MAG: DUF3987 domain-containing protein [Rhodomicrobium sp.]
MNRASGTARNGAYQESTAKKPFEAYAATLIANGYSPLPIKVRSKKPIPYGWSKRCETPLKDTEIAKLIRDHPAAGIGIACSYKNIVGIDNDTDRPEIMAAIKSVLPATPVSKRGKRGCTDFFRSSKPLASRRFKTPDGETLVEILAAGRQTVLPPTMHPELGKPYAWLTNATLFDMRVEDLPLIPDDIASKIEAVLGNWIEKPEHRIGEGLGAEEVIAKNLTASERKRYEGFVAAAIAARAGELAELGEGSRNATLFRDICRLGKFAHHGIISGNDLGSPFYDACKENGLVHEEGEAAVIATINSALAASKRDPLRALADRPRDAAGDGGPWLKPLPLVSKIEPLPYPVTALPKIIKAAAEEVHGFVKTPLAMVASSSIAAISLAAQALIDVRRDEELLSPVSLFMLTIAESGERKTQCDKMFTRAIEHYQDEQDSAAKPLFRGYKTALSAWEAEYAGIKDRIRRQTSKGECATMSQLDLSMHEDTKPEKPRVPKLMRKESTPEGLAKKLQHEWPSAGIISNEAGIVFGAHGMNYQSIMRNLALLNTLWDGGRYQSDRSDDERNRDVRGARLTMGLMAQEAVLQEFFEQSNGLARGSGFFARFLTSWPESTMGTRFYEAPTEGMPALKAFNDRLSQILACAVPINEDGALHPAEMQLSPKAKAEWIKYHDRVEAMLGQGGELFDVKDVAAKSADNAARLAALFAFFERGADATIERDDFVRASKIALWHLSEARRFLGEFSMPSELAGAARLEGWLIEQCKKDGGNTVSRSAVLTRGPYGLRKKETLDAALTELRELNRAREVKAAAGKQRNIEVNPALLKDREN